MAPKDYAEYMHYFAVFLQFMTLIIAINSYKKFKTKFAFYFISFLSFVFIIEFIGLIYLYHLEENSYEIYNIYTFFEFNIISLMYLSIIRDVKTLKLLKLLAVLFNIFYVLSFVFEQLQTYSITIEYFIFSIFSVCYLRELLNSDKMLNFKRHLPFWVTTGFLIFYLSSIPFQFIRAGLDGRELFIIQQMVFYIMQGCFIYGLIWSKKEI